jgi:hypothetical protein
VATVSFNCVNAVLAGAQKGIEFQVALVVVPSKVIEEDVRILR